MSTYKELGAVIPFGLGADGSAYLLGHIHQLYLFDEPPLVTSNDPRGGGGSFPLAPGQIHNFFKPVHRNVMVPYKAGTVKNRRVVIKVVLNGKEETREFLIPGFEEPRVVGNIDLRSQRPSINALWDRSPYKAWAQATPRVISISVEQRPIATVSFAADQTEPDDK